MNLDIKAEQATYRTLLDDSRSLMMSMLDDGGSPFISYAPYVRLNGDFYVYLSRIAEHYDYLMARSQVQVMVIADESASPNLFARHRARFSCTATRLPDADDHSEIFDLFTKRFGASIIKLLRGLDLSLFQLSPQTGRFVSGFGKAFDVDAGQRFDHVVSGDGSR